MHCLLLLVKRIFRQRPNNNSDATWIYSEQEQQTKELSSQVQAVFASGSKGIHFKRNNLASFAKEITGTMLLFPDYKVDQFALWSL